MIVEKNLDRFDTTYLTWEHPSLSRERLHALLYGCYKKFYSSGHALKNVRRLNFKRGGFLSETMISLGNSAFTRFSARRRTHPMAGGIKRVSLDRAADFLPLRKQFFGFEFAPLPGILQLPEADVALNRLANSPCGARRFRRRSSINGFVARVICGAGEQKFRPALLACYSSPARMIRFLPTGGFCGTIAGQLRRDCSRRAATASARFASTTQRVKTTTLPARRQRFVAILNSVSGSGRSAGGDGVRRPHFDRMVCPHSFSRRKRLMRAFPLNGRWLSTAFSFTLLVAFVLSFGAGAALAQADSTSANLSGFVRDPQGAVVPGATVTARNDSTSVVRTATTNEEGFYQLTNLRPALQLTIEAANFKTTAIEALTVTVGQRADLDVALEIGQITDVVTVTGQHRAHRDLEDQLRTRLTRRASRTSRSTSATTSTSRSRPRL